MKKKQFTTCVMFISFFNIVIGQTINIPDTNFKNYLLSSSPARNIASTQLPSFNSGVWSVSTYSSIDTNLDGEIQISEAQQIKYLNISTSDIYDISGFEFFSNLIALNIIGTQIYLLNGIGYLTNLKYLKVSSNRSIADLNLSNLGSLEYLNCSQNFLRSLNLQGDTSLKEIYCNENQLQSLNIDDQINLKALYCYDNSITNINFSTNTLLERIDCYENLIQSLEIQNMPNLQLINCNNNQISLLSLQNLPLLKSLYCGYNQLTSLDVSSLSKLQTLSLTQNRLNNLNISGLSWLLYLFLDNNLLTNLDISGMSRLQQLNCCNNLLENITLGNNDLLKNLYCFENRLTNLNLTGMYSLTDLRCNNNYLTGLNVSGLNLLTELYCGNNRFEVLEIANCRNLTNVYAYNGNLRYLNILNLPSALRIDVSNNDIIEIIAKNAGGIYFSGNPNIQYICVDEWNVDGVYGLANAFGYTNCIVNDYCDFTPGGTYYTINGNNSIGYDFNDCEFNSINYPNLKFETSTGTYVCNNTGNYNILTKNIEFDLTPVLEYGNFFNVSPNILSINFQIEANPYTQNFCLTPNGIHHNLEVTIIPTTIARPGFDTEYKIIYKNNGNQLENGNLQYYFNDNLVDFISANITPNAISTGNLQWNYTNLQPFETREINIKFNLNTPSENSPLNSGDYLGYEAIIQPISGDETPDDNSSELKQLVVNSMDPNDKTCIEGDKINITQVGDYLHYIIRFENTGTYYAENIVVVDTIDETVFDISTLQPISSSHNNIVRIKNNKIEFIFEGINLPFDDASNDGYVAFKIKTKPTLILGTNIQNRASIYFDYNFPIHTNNTSTIVSDFTNMDEIEENVINILPNPVHNQLFINSKYDINQMQITDVSGKMVLQTKGDNLRNIDVSALQNGMYMMEIHTEKGNHTIRFVKK